MILESIVIFGVFIFIAILFYKQANEQFEILQLEAERLHEIPTLYTDHSPIVVRGISIPNIGTFEQFQKRKHILQMAIAPKRTLHSVLNSPTDLSEWTFKPETAQFLSNEAGLHIWFRQLVYSNFLPNPYTKWMYNFKTYLYPHHRGLFKTTAFQTIIMPTQGEASVSLILQTAEAYLPPRWRERPFSSLTPSDTPLVSQIQFVEVKLKKGNLIVLPAHIIIDITTSKEAEDNAWCMIAEIHHPISRFAS